MRPRHGRPVLDELDLLRDRGERRLYHLDGIGSIRWAGWGRPQATATSRAEDGEWTFARTGMLRPTTTATDAVGTVVGQYTSRFLGGGTLQWRDRDLTLRSQGLFPRRHAVADGPVPLVTLRPRASGRRPVTVTLDAPADDPMLVLFAVFVVRLIEDDAASASSST